MTFCISPWHEYQQFADNDDTVYLYRTDDQPIIKPLGFYPVEGMDVGSLASE